MKLRLLRRVVAAVAVLAAAMIAVLPTPAIAQAGLAGAPVALCFKKAAPGDSVQQVLTRPKGFDCTTEQRKFGRGDFWAVASVLPARASAGVPIAVRIASLWQRSVTLYGRYADGAIVSATLDERDIARHLQLGAVVEQVLPARATPLVQLIWRVDGSENVRGIVVGARVATIAESTHANLVMAVMYAAFGGLCIALLVHNLAMWGAMQHSFQVAYCVMVAALVLYAVSTSGAVAWLWPDLLETVRLRMNYLMLAISASSAIWFARTYFEPRVFSRPLRWASVAICVSLLGSAVAFVLLAPWQAATLHRIYAFAFLGVVAIVPPVLWSAWRQKSDYLWIFAIAWAAPIVFAGLRVANGLNLIRWSFWVDNSTILAMTAEALMSSLAIAYRIRLLSRERDDARVQELAARALADIDPLTGLLNRRAFLARAIGRSGQQVLMIADLDHFKVVNETIGHDGGDEVLRVFARSLRLSLPADALVARIGGEEFAIVVPADRPIDPEKLLDRLRTERMPFDLAVTASIGASTGPLATEIDWKRLYRRADRALYAAKAEGRDRARHDVLLAA